MSLSNYIELGVMLLIVVVGIILVKICLKLVSSVWCDCDIFKKRELKGKRIDKEIERKSLRNKDIL